VRFLLDEGVDINAKDERGWTPLHFAARTGSVEVVRTLLGRGADVNAKCKGPVDQNGTALMIALYRWNGVPTNEESEAIVTALLAKGADVNERASRGKTPLMLAANFRNAKVVQTLLDAGARPEDTDDSGRKAAAFVENNSSENNEAEHAEILRLLQNHEATS